MRFLFAVLAVAGGFAVSIGAQPKRSAAWESKDGSAIAAALTEMQKAATARDAKALGMVYAEDAQWINAFGDQREGRAEIAKFYERLFAHPGERDVRASLLGGPRLKFLRPDVAVLHWITESEGQRDDLGKPVGKRKTHHSVVMTKARDRWLIADHVIMDEKARFDRARRQNELDGDLTKGGL